MSGSSGSEQRARRHDVRIRLRTEDELRQLDQYVKDAGFYGLHARGDWLRSHLPGVNIQTAPPPSPPAVHPWVDTIAAIDGLANELANVNMLLDRIQSGVLRFNDADRLRRTLPATIEDLLIKAGAIIDVLHGRIKDL